MKILDLFCGTKSIANAFAEHGHEVYTVDWNPEFEPTLCADIGTLTAQDIINLCGGRPDVIWASPDCTSYSVAGISHHRRRNPDTGELMPITDYARMCDEINAHVVKLIEDLNPRYYFIENPRGGMRKMGFVRNIPRYTVTYCKYGEERMKPTDIWTNHPNPQFKPPCKMGDPCHVASPRGAQTGTQGIKGARDRARIPKELCEHIVEICERVEGTDTQDHLCSIPNVNALSAILKCQAVLGRYDRVLVAISGGSDSDIVLDMVERCKSAHNEITYVFFDTGLEYRATIDHLDYLERRYGVKIHRERPEKPVPLAVKEYGVPFLSKDISGKIRRLMNHGFDWVDTAEGNVSSALKWWRNENQGSKFNISNIVYLKEFLMAHPPEYPIAAECCTYAKKKMGRRACKTYNAQLEVMGIRKCEGGVRASAYKNCYSQNDDSIDTFRPIFWLTNRDKRDYEDYFGIVHSRCYTEYGLKRTGCVGCPFNKDILGELKIIAEYEPKLYKACINVFGRSYEYTRQFHEFRGEMKRRMCEECGDEE